MKRIVTIQDISCVGKCSLTVALPVLAEEDWSILDVIDIDAEQATEAATVNAPEMEETELTAREDFINRIIALGEQLYISANGKSQRAHYKEDIYVCKNFTVHLFRENRDDFRMAEYPDVQLRIPCNADAYILQLRIRRQKNIQFLSLNIYRMDHMSMNHLL